MTLLSNNSEDGNQRYKYLAFGVLFVWMRMRHGNIQVENISAQLILGIDDIIYALKALPEPDFQNFTNWFNNLSKADLQQIVNEVSIVSLDSISFFNTLGTLILDANESHRNGAIFTPSWLASALTKRAIHHWKNLNSDRTEPALVGDLSCGPGAFLLNLLNELTCSTRIIGVDRCPELACLARLSLISTRNTVIEVGDTLLNIRRQPEMFDYTLDVPSSNYDVLVGNPPFVRSQVLPSEYSVRLKRLYPSLTKGNFDLVVLFLAHTLESLAPGGVAGIVVSNKFMTSRYGAAICRLLYERARIIEIMNFGDGQIFPDHTTYTCTILFANLKKAEKFFVTSFPHGLDWRDDRLHFELAQRVELPIETLSSHPWNLSSGIQSEILTQMQRSTLPYITDVFTNISQGIRTGANSVFMINEQEANLIEKDLIQPYVDGQNIRRCSITHTGRYLLCPYLINKASMMEVISPNILENNYPVAWKYLMRHRNALTERGLKDNVFWYSYSRVQNLEIKKHPKILVREMMPRAEFAADISGQFAISSGYALIARSDMTIDELQLWAAILSTPTMEYQLRLVGTQLHSGWFRVMAHHLRKVKLPVLQGNDLALAYHLAIKLHGDSNNTALWDQLDSLVASNFGLTKEMHNEIKSYLCHIHSISLSQDKLLNNDDLLDIKEYKNNHEEDKNEKQIVTSTLDTTYPDLDPEQRKRYIPVELPRYIQLHRQREELSKLVTFSPNKQTPIFRWYNYTQGYSSILVKKLIDELDIDRRDVVYDPFAGSGTTLLTCRMLGIESFGLEISPLLVWISSLKIQLWNLVEVQHAIKMVEETQVNPAIPDELLFLDYFQRAYSKDILGQIIGWRNWISRLNCDQPIRDLLMLGLISILEEVSMIRKHGSHYRFLNKETSVGLTKLNIPIISLDSDIKPIFVKRLKEMSKDIEEVSFSKPLAPCNILIGDARTDLKSYKHVDYVITSPPYLNRNNYIAQQKAEISLLNLLPSYDAYRDLVRKTFRSHVESDLPVVPETTIPEVREILNSFEMTKNNNPKIPHMIAGYFEDLKDTLNLLYHVVKPGGKLAFVVGNSRWGGVVIPVDHLLALLAERTGYTVERILVTRLKGNSPQQMRRYGRIPVRESIVILKRP